MSTALHAGARVAGLLGAAGLLPVTGVRGKVGLLLASIVALLSALSISGLVRELATGAWTREIPQRALRGLLAAALAVMALAALEGALLHAADLRVGHAPLIDAGVPGKEDDGEEGEEGENKEGGWWA